MTRRFWTEDERAEVMRCYPYETTDAIAKVEG